MKEKPIPKAVPKKVKGTVLFTVVAVMMVLIVFLMGTLALAATANRRAQTNFQKSQTETKARAAIDSVVQAINNDTAATGIRKDLLAGKAVRVSLVDSKGESKPYVVSMSKTDQQRSGHKAGAWINYDVYELSVTVDDMILASTTYSAYITAETEESTTDPPKSNSSGDGAFVSMGGLSTNIGTGGHVTGGTFIGLTNSTEDGVTYQVSGTGESILDAPVYIKGNFTGSTSAPLPILFSKQGQHMAVTGNFNAEHLVLMQPTSNFIWDACTLSYVTLPYLYVGKNLSFIDKGDTRFTSMFGDYAKQNNFGTTDVPVNVFAGSINKSAGSGPVGNFGGADFYGDVYAFDDNARFSNGNANCIGKSNNPTKLYEWTKQAWMGDKINSNTGSNFSGNYYSAGDTEFYCQNDNVLINGDVRVDGDIIISGNKKLVVNGNILCGGTITVLNDEGIYCKTAGKGKVYASAIVSNKKIECNESHAFNKSGSGEVQNYSELPKGTQIGTQQITKTIVPKTDEGYEDGMKIDYISLYGQPVASITYAYYESSTAVVTLDGQAPTTVTTPPELIVSEARINWGKNPANDAEIKSNPWGDYANLKNELNGKLAENGVTTTEGVYEGANINDVLPAGYTEVYPSAYKKENIKTTIRLTEPSRDSYDYTDTIDELREEANVKDMDGNLIDIPKLSYSDARWNDSSVPQYSRVGSEYIVKDHIWLSGTPNNGCRTVIDATAHDIAVVLDNINMGDSQYRGADGVNFLVKGNNNVYFYIKGEVRLSGHLVTEKILNEIVKGSGDVTITQYNSEYIPNIIIYADEAGNPSFYTGGSDMIVSAMVKAPSLAWHQGLGQQVNAKITYKQADGSTSYFGQHSNARDKMKAIGLIGQLIAGDIDAAGNRDFSLIYTIYGSSDVSSCCKCANCTQAKGCPCTCSCCHCTEEETTEPPSEPVTEATENKTITDAESMQVLYYNFY